SLRHDWPFDTAMASPLFAEAPFSHSLEVSKQTLPVWSNSPADLIGVDAIKSRGAQFTLASDGRMLQFTGDDSEFGDQLATAPVVVEKNMDYIVTLLIKLEKGHMAAKMTSPDLRIALASARIPDAETEERKRAKRRSKQNAEGDDDSTEQRSTSVVMMPFSSGNRTEVRLVISNNGKETVPPLAQIGKADLFEMGPTRFLWARYPRAIFRGIQRNLYTTGRMLPLIIIGVILLMITSRWRQ